MNFRNLNLPSLIPKFFDLYLSKPICSRRRISPIYLRPSFRLRSLIPSCLLLICISSNLSARVDATSVKESRTQGVRRRASIPTSMASMLMVANPSFLAFKGTCSRAPDCSRIHGELNKPCVASVRHPRVGFVGAHKVFDSRP